jgi:replicative DNA helicase
LITTRIETTILKHLVNDEDYARKVIPFLQSEYFGESTERLLFNKIVDFVGEYNTIPTRESLLIELDRDDKIADGEFQSATELVKNLTIDEKVQKEWLLDQTEIFCQERAVYNAIMDSIQIIDGKDKDHGKGAIPDILTKALSVSFDTNIGHDFLEDYDDRFEFYHRKEERIPFDIELLNQITKGGLPRKSLNIILAGTGVGKSLAMCHMASANLMDGKNVLYITMEMAEEKIAERIDANLLNVSLDNLNTLPQQMYQKKVKRVKEKTLGKLIIKEYPTASAHVGHFRHVVNELGLKRNFTPDIIYVDYLNICMSQRIRAGSNVNSYTYIKAIAEELRGLAVEKNIPIVSATQTTRSGYSNSDPGLEDTSESFGLPATADLMLAMISTEELEDLDQIMIKQLKNRYSDPGSNKRFVVGIDRAKMRLFDAEDQDGVMNDSRKKEDDKPINTFGNRERKDFSTLQV